MYEFEWRDEYEPRSRRHMGYFVYRVGYKVIPRSKARTETSRTFYCGCYKKDYAEAIVAALNDRERLYRNQ